MNTRTSLDIPFVPAPRITTVAGYLLTRLAQAGLASVFGVPGDYNLGLLDEIAARPDLAWIGMATEQGAGYAADSYARLRASARWSPRSASASCPRSTPSPAPTPSPSRSCTSSAPRP